MVDNFNLARFVEAQNGVYHKALSEIRHGQKRTHWMWFVLPQCTGLGRSEMSQVFGIASLAEAEAFLAHPVLGPRYHECVAALQDLIGLTAQSVFGPVDANKLRSSLTLFAQAGGGEVVEAALLRWCGGADPKTLEILARHSAVGETSRR